IKYAPGGRVSVYGRGTQLIIEDNGVGIAREDLPRIFEQGFTGCNGRMDKRATGIGLYLSRQICRRLGHTIAVDSQLGQGTKVTIGLARPDLEVE
ncbi:MAG: sensor histidine kinase, partial [Oscillospiraceae bacterium]|nr:sensor histidine kinase [Oscillospiraceae bacterium]